MANRLSLHTELRALIGNNNVYFQPPESIKIKCPAIVYELSKINQQYADNKTYHFTNAYQLTVIDKDPDSDLVERIITTFPYARFDRHFVSDNLNHDIVILYY